MQGARLDLILDATNVGFLCTDCEGRITYVNHAAAEKLGSTKREITGRHIADVVPAARDAFREIIRTGRPQTGVRIEAAGTTVIADRNPIRDGDRIVGVVSVFKELSRYEDTAKELKAYRELSQELEAVFQSSYDGLYMTDGNAKTLFYNKSYMRISGIAEEELRDRNTQELVRNGTINRSASVEVIKAGKSVTIMQEFPNGRTAIVTGVPVFDASGKIRRVVSNVRDITELNELRARVEEHRTLAERYRDELSLIRLKGVHKDAAAFRSESMGTCVALAMRVSNVASPVLLTGESGVGKGLLAKLVHTAGSRKNGPYIHVNCGAIPANLMESELFGYQKGAFTSAADEGKPGLFEMADKGTLFLDEIGEIPLPLQVKLLKAIEEGEVRRVGGVRPKRIDARIVTATNRNLHEMIRSAAFREDLFFRLNVFPIHIPPLRDRREDIPPLVDRILGDLNAKYGQGKRVLPETLELLTRYPFPGNVRELQNTLERAFILSDGKWIKPAHLPREVQGRGAGTATGASPDSFDGQSLREMLDNLERRVIENLWRSHRTTYQIAEILKVNQSTVVRKLKKWRLGGGAGSHTTLQ